MRWMLRLVMALVACHVLLFSAVGILQRTMPAGAAPAGPVN